MKTGGYDQKIITQIKKENEKISKQWLKIHYYVILGIVTVAFLIELIMFFALSNQNLLATTAFYYFIKYLFFPSSLNIILMIICTLIIRSNYSLVCKNYVNSFALLLICFILSFVHSNFVSINFIFVAPIVMTIIYGDLKLTTLVSFSTVVLNFMSTQFITWDPTKVYGEFHLMNNLLTCLFLICLYVIAFLVITFEQNKQVTVIKNDMERNRLKQEVKHDVLTNVFNRYALKTYFEELKQEEDLYIAIIDVDNFKGVNDNFGHIIGDEVLIELGQIMLNHKRRLYPFRIGGDEFCILFPNMTFDEVVTVCKNISNEFQEQIIVKKGIEFSTLSIGIAEYIEGMDLKQFINCADIALYKAKQDGKNCICKYL